ncbi:hypothetical protein K2Y11_16370, partial [bacterium]|nr:hypothetical protein [bacterium]
APYQSWDLAVISGASSANNIFAGNCLFVGYGDRKINLNLKNDGLHLVANAYYGVNNPSSYNGDPFGLSLLTAPSYPLSLNVDSPIVGGARYSTFGYAVDYDFFGHTRNLSAPTQGAVEFDWSTLPVTDGGSYYLLAAGQSLTLESRNIRSDATYSWDLNEDGVYGDAIGATPTLTWSQLRSLGIGNGTYHIRLQTILGSTVLVSESAILKVLDQTPYSNAGSSITINQGTTLSLNASKSMSFTTSESLSYSWDVNGDGVFGDAVGLSPQLTYTQLASLGLRGGQTYSIRVQVAQSFDSSNYSISAPITLTYKSVPIVAKSGGPYSIIEGQSLTLTATGSSDPLGQSLTYSWDVNGDGSFGDAFGLNPTLSWGQLNALGISDGLTSRNLRVQVSDSWGRSTASATTLLTVNNAAPTANIAGIGPVVRQETVTYTLTATDPSSVDQAAGFTFKIDWNNDGIDDQTVIGASGTTITHVWSSLGSSTIRVTASDKDGGVSSGSTLVQSIVEYTTRVNGGATDLIWGGANNFNSYSFSQDAPGTIHIYTWDVNLDPWMVQTDIGTATGITGALRCYGGNQTDVLVLFYINNAYVYGNDGDDTFGSIFQKGGGATNFYGGNGDDHFITAVGDDTTMNFVGGENNDTVIFLSATSSVVANLDMGNGNDVVLGRPESSLTMNVTGGAGDDLIIGGTGSDTLDGGSGNDLIIGDFDAINPGSADLLIGGDGNDLIIGSGGGDTLNGGLGQDLLIAGSIPLSRNNGVAYFPEDFFPDDSYPETPGYQEIWDVWRDGSSLENRQAELQGTVSSPLESQYYLQPGTTILDDGAVDSVLGGSDGDWLVYDPGQDISDYVNETDRRTII